MSNPRVHIFIYTYNKVRELRETLESLQKTAYDNFKVFVLNNGSTDGTAAFIPNLDGMFSEHKLISLPVNVGAPAARNWLVHDPENRYADFLVFFDDDIIVKPDWLALMLDSLAANPAAGVVGAKIINASGDKIIQHSGGLLTRPDEWIDQVILFSNVADDGRFDNISQRDYLMGCANVYRREVFDVAGDFDLQFSPTQFDDVDHHLRLRLHGYQVIFNGHVEVRHLRNSGGATTPNHLANRFKLANKYNRDQIETIIKAGALGDFIAKHPWVTQQQ